MSSPRVCPGSGAKVAGKGVLLVHRAGRQEILACIACPVCRERQLVGVVGKRRSYNTVDGLLLMHARPSARPQGEGEALAGAVSGPRAASPASAGASPDSRSAA